MGARGPEPKKINFEEFDKLIAYQCTQEEIAAFFNCSVDTLDNICRRDLGLKLSEVWDKKISLGRVKLKKIQFNLAESGSAAMAIFLGKHLLGQKDEPDDLSKVMQQSGLSEQDVIALIKKNELEAKATGKKSFEEFCAAGDYPVPFAKQVEMMRFGMEGTEPRLLLGARGYGKTDYVVIAGIAYDIYLHPLESTNLIMTKSRERNAAMLTEIQNLLMKNGVKFDVANSTSLRAMGLIGKDHSVSTVTVRTTSLRGRHPKRIVMDDPVTEDDTSEATRKLVKKKYNELQKLTKNVLIIGQPAHKYDLYAELRGLLSKLEVAWGAIPELDHDLEAQRLAGVDEASIQASYFLKILDEGATPFDNIKTIDKFPMPVNSVAWIDPAHMGKDFTAISILCQHFQGVAVVGFTWRRAWNHCLDEMVAKMKQFGVRRVAFETNALGDQPLIMLRQLFDGTGVGVVGIHSIQNKHSKIMAAGAYAHLIHLSKESDAQYRKQVVEYEYNSKNDDAPDSLASALSWIGLIRGKGE